MVAYRVAFWQIIFLIGPEAAQFMKVVKQESQYAKYICM